MVSLPGGAGPDPAVGDRPSPTTAAHGVNHRLDQAVRALVREAARTAMAPADIDAGLDALLRDVPRYTAKFSSDKYTCPGAKQIFRHSMGENSQQYEYEKFLEANSNAKQLGLRHQPWPPYYVLQTPTLDLDDVYALMEEAEEAFGVEFDALPPPRLDLFRASAPPAPAA